MIPASGERAMTNKPAIHVQAVEIQYLARPGFLLTTLVLSDMYKDLSLLKLSLLNSLRYN